MPNASPGQSHLTRKGQRTRQRIVEAAADLIFERGVAHTRIEDVREAAGVSSSQMYHYFDDKHALVQAVIERQTDLIVAGQERNRPDSLEALRQWRDFVIEVEQKLSCRGGCPMGSLGSELAESDPQSRSHIALGFERWEAVIRDGLRQMHARGELVPAADPDALALAFLTALQGGLLLTQIRRETGPLEAGLDAMIALVVSLYVPPERRVARPVAVGD
jgi:TetR/AcrR family transcriptional repressor of nem operon